MTEQMRIVVPHGKAVLLGNSHPGADWIESARHDLPNGGAWLIHQAGTFVYLCVDFGERQSGIVDLFLSLPDGKTYDLHSSAKLGQRLLEDKRYPDWAWWNNEGWTANVRRFDSDEPLTFLPERVWKFQLDRRHFTSSQWKAMLSLTLLGTEGQDVIVYPENADPTDTSSWMVLDFGKS